MKKVLRFTIGMLMFPAVLWLGAMFFLLMFLEPKEEA